MRTLRCNNLAEAIGARTGPPRDSLVHELERRLWEQVTVQQTIALEREVS